MAEMEITVMNVRLALVFLFVGIELTACSGSGGNSAMTPVPFTSFSAITSNQPVQATGISQTVNATTAPLGNVTSTTVAAVDTLNSSAQMTYSALPAMSAFSFSTPASSPGWAGLNVLCTGASGVCTASSGNSLGVIINPLDTPVATLQWNYQSFGYWLVNLSSTAKIAAAMSFGNPTPPAGVPVGGTASYSNGLSGGTYIDPSGAVFIYRATMNASADFGARTVTFSTTGTQTAPVPSPISVPATFSPNSSLDIIIMTTPPYAPGTNGFTGTVQAPGATGTIATPGLTGTMTGKFYGPTAQEIGGVLSLKAASGPETMIGGFGGKQ